jgi:hypothetical protein
MAHGRRLLANAVPGLGMPLLGDATMIPGPCLLLAQSGHSTTEFRCPLLGVKQTLLTRNKALRIAANIRRAAIRHGDSKTP